MKNHLPVSMAFFLSVFLVNANSAQPEVTSPLNLEWRDLKTAPELDFYTYANGTWQQQNPIPPDYSSWGPFYILQEKTLDKIHQLLISAADDQQAKPDSIEAKVGNFYFSGMNETLINQLGVAPLQPLFFRINSINNLKDLQAVIAELQLIGVDVLFGFGSMQDFANSKEVIGVASQGGLGLPDREYYLNKNEKFKLIRAAYLKHVAKMFELLGDAPADAVKEADIVMAIEYTLAVASMSQTEQRDPHAIYNMKNLKQLDEITPDFSWSNYFAAIKQPSLKRINLAMPNFFKKMDEQLKSVAIEDWKIYLRWHLLDDYAAYLSQPFVDQNFKMNAALTGTEKILPRWKRVVKTENSALGFAIGKLYVDKYFPPSAKKEVIEIVQNIRRAFEKDLKNLAWMKPTTRAAALKKLALIEERVGYPNKWWDYSSLKIDRGPYVLNVVRVNQFLVQRDLNKIGKPVDRAEWAMTPQTINAYYDPSMNNINLPAGILQPPFFDPNAPAAINYGAIGFVIGHELTHGFDDQGAQFDGHGNLKDWWTPEDLAKFREATNCIVNQFSQYKVDGDLPVQGKLVVGEATADLGGLTLAYHAFHDSKEFKDAKTIDGLTPDQQFFIGAAHVWAGNIRPAQARNNVTTDPHPPLMFRVNGTLANMPEFHSAFQINVPSVMINSKRCIIW